MGGIVHKSYKHTLAAITAALLLSAAVPTASARNLSVSNARFRIVWDQLSQQTGLGIDIECRVILEGSFHRSTIAKISRSLIGAVTSARSDNATCTGGTLWMHNGSEIVLGVRAAQSLPWHITYEDFEGTLPRVSSIDLLLRGIRLTFRIAGFCLATYGRPENNFTTRLAIEAAGNATTLTPVAGQNSISVLTIHEQPLFCPPSLSFSGLADVTLTGNDTPIRITLIA
jgi:hypothetical protein